MEDRFEDKTLRVIGVDPSGAVRQLLNEVMKILGFENFQAMSSVKDVLQSLEVEPADWLILPLMADQEVNAVQLLRLISINSGLKNIRVSFLLEDEEAYILPDAFSMGLLSSFTKPFNKDSLTADLQGFIDQFEEHDWDSTRLSASYCYRHLIEAKLFQSAVDLCNSILNLYPGDPQTLINLAKPYHELEQDDDGKSALRQALLVGEERGEEIEALATQLFGEGSLNNEDTSITRNLLDISCCVIIDADEESSGKIRGILESVGVSEIIEFQDGESAWVWLQENESPSIIFHEWRIPKLTGPFLVQRIRKKYPCISLIVVTDLVTQKDQPLIQEMGVASIINKPIDDPEFLKILIHTVRQERVPTEMEFLEQKIRQNLAANNTAEASELIKKYRESKSIPRSRKVKIEAELAYFEGDYEKARNLGVESLKNSADSVQILNLLGKTLMQLLDYESALRCFEKAQMMSPKNIQRLCAIAEANSEIEKNQDAADSLDAASKADPGNPEIEQTTAKIAISSGNSLKAKDIMAQMESLSELVAYMNNKAVTLSRCEKYDTGIELYKKTINSIPDKRKDLQAIVAYNMALAYVRVGEQGEAAETLEDVIEFGETKVLLKSRSLKRRLEKAMESGARLDLNEGKATDNPDASSSKNEELGAADGSAPTASKESGTNVKNLEASATVEIKPGEMCCFRIFDNTNSSDEKICALFAKLPRFKARDAIERSATGGADRLNAAG